MIYDDNISPSECKSGKHNNDSDDENSDHIAILKHNDVIMKCTQLLYKCTLYHLWF